MRRKLPEVGRKDFRVVFFPACSRVSSRHPRVSDEETRFRRGAARTACWRCVLAVRVRQRAICGGDGRAVFVSLGKRPALMAADNLKRRCAFYHHQAAESSSTSWSRCRPVGTPAHHNSIFITFCVYTTDGKGCSCRGATEG